jgi:hypothetical protein
LDQWIRHRMRAIQLKQWRRGTTAYRELLARGAIAFPAAYFDSLGLPRMLTAT